MSKSIQKIIGHLRATPAGATKAEMSDVLSVGPRHFEKVLPVMVASGQIVGVNEGGGGKDTRTKRYFAAEHAPQQSAKPAEFRRAKQRTAPVRLVGEPIITSATKVTICPPFKGDPRVNFDVPPGWKGQITQDRDLERAAASTGAA